MTNRMHGTSTFSRLLPRGSIEVAKVQGPPSPCKDGITPFWFLSQEKVCWSSTTMMLLLCTGISFDSFTLQSVKCNRRNGGKRLQSTEMAGSSGWKWREVVAGGKRGRRESSSKRGKWYEVWWSSDRRFFVPLLLLCAPNDDQSTVSISTTTCDTQSLSILSLVSYNHGASFFTGQ